MRRSPKKVPTPASACASRAPQVPTQIKYVRSLATYAIRHASGSRSRSVFLMGAEQKARPLELQQRSCAARARNVVAAREEGDLRGRVQTDDASLIGVTGLR